MFRFLFSKYRRWLILCVAALVGLQAAAIVIYDFGLNELRSTATDVFMLVSSACLLVGAPFALAFDATRRHGVYVPGTRARAGAFLGIALNSIVGGVSSLIGLLQALLRSWLPENANADPSTYLLVLVPSLLFSIWIGGVMGWLGNRIASLTTRWRTL